MKAVQHFHGNCRCVKRSSIINHPDTVLDCQSLEIWGFGGDRCLRFLFCVNTLDLCE